MTGILASLASMLPKIDPQLNGHVDPQVEIQDACNCCTGPLTCCFPIFRKKCDKHEDIGIVDKKGEVKKKDQAQDLKSLTFREMMNDEALKK